MSFSAEYISYKATNSFSSLVLDYLEEKDSLRKFYQFSPTAEGIKDAIAARKNFPVPRQILQTVLLEDYAGMSLPEKLQVNIDSLSAENCFTICTAHQPNIFTGHLYFIYKILHAIKLSDELNAQYPDKKFVPVYYMGSEDADIEELGEVNIEGEKYLWNPSQGGAVGRMIIDDKLLKIIAEIKAQTGVLPFGTDILELITSCYKKGETIEQATFKFVHELFGNYGLVVLQPDNARLKEVFLDITAKEIKTSYSHNIVEKTIEAFPQEYKVQAGGRDVNLFYLKDDKRIRVEKLGDKFSLENEYENITGDELFRVFKDNPKSISPNVILRPVFQEMILPNVAFIGGGGELAYWLELKEVFEASNAFFPVLILRNSFTVIADNNRQLIDKKQLSIYDIFLPELDIVNKLVLRNYKRRLDLQEEMQILFGIYQKIKNTAKLVDLTLEKHSLALQAKALDKLESLEKKMLRAARKQSEAEGRQINKLKERLFPGGNLQERVDNLIPYYGTYGHNFIDEVYVASLTLRSQFCVLKEMDNG